jgi:ABC-type multidrug transport system permease subunit
VPQYSLANKIHVITYNIPNTLEKNLSAYQFKWNFYIWATVIMDDISAMIAIIFLIYIKAFISISPVSTQSLEKYILVFKPCST